MTKKFAIVGTGGYIAPRHLKAIKDCHGSLVAALDKNDSVGILDQHFRDVEFFLDEDEFFNFIKKNKVEIVSICSPNFLHKEHILKSFEAGCDVICEKPLALKVSELNELKSVASSKGRTLGTILQLRVHPSLRKIKDQIQKNPGEFSEVELTYITSRGPWFHKSWKGDISKSGGLPTNIGVHFFDMLCWLFGNPNKNEVYLKNNHKFSGHLEFENAKVNWFLSVDRGDLPKQASDEGKTTYRSITINSKEIEFSSGFTELHSVLYQDFLNGEFFSVDDVMAGIKIVEELREMNESKPSGEGHPFIL